MRKIKVVVLLVQQLQHGFTKNAKVSPNLTVAQMSSYLPTHYAFTCVLVPHKKYKSLRKTHTWKCRYMSIQFSFNKPDATTRVRLPIKRSNRYQLTSYAIGQGSDGKVRASW